METKAEYKTPRTPKHVVLAVLADRPIAYHPILAKALGGVKQAIFVSQLLYWTGKGKRGDGFIWKNQEEWADETGLSVYEQRTARKHLVKAGILQEKRMSIPARLYYRLDTDKLLEVVQQYHEQDVDVVQILNNTTSTTIPEITPETTDQEEPAPPDSPPPADEEMVEREGTAGLSQEEIELAETEAMFNKTGDAQLSKEEFMSRHDGLAAVTGQEMKVSHDIYGEPWLNEPVEAWCKLAGKIFGEMSVGTRIKLGGIFYKIGAATDSDAAQVAEAIGNFKAEHPWWKYKFDWPTDGFIQRLGMMLVPDDPNANPHVDEVVYEQPTHVEYEEPDWLGVKP